MSPLSHSPMDECRHYSLIMELEQSLIYIIPRPLNSPPSPTQSTNWPTTLTGTYLDLCERIPFCATTATAPCHFYTFCYAFLWFWHSKNGLLDKFMYTKLCIFIWHFSHQTTEVMSYCSTFIAHTAQDHSLTWDQRLAGRADDSMGLPMRDVGFIEIPPL